MNSHKLIDIYKKVIDLLKRLLNKIKPKSKSTVISNKREHFRIIEKIEQAFFHNSLCYFLHDKAFEKDYTEDSLLKIYPDYKKVLGKPYVKWENYFDNFIDIIREVEASMTDWLEKHNYNENIKMAPLDRFEYYVFKKSEEEAISLIYK